MAEAQTRLFLFEWDAEPAAKRTELLRGAGFEVEVECEDGARGCRQVLNHPPDMILFDLEKRASHSRASAEAIRGYKAGRRIPMLFIGGGAADAGKVKAKILNPLFTAPELLLHRLSKLKD